MLTNKQEVIQRFCALSAKVMNEAFASQHPADCFCNQSHCREEHFQFSDLILLYISQAVEEKLQRENK